MSSYSENIMDLITQLVKGSFTTKHIRITDLEEYCFQHILRYISLKQLFYIRGVNKYFLKNVDQYLQNERVMKYTCDLNGIKMLNGEYVFNGRLFDFILSKMPNVRVIKFDERDEMCGALSTTHYNVIQSMAYNLIMLNELHITRCRAITKPNIELLVETFPNLTHLTITLYNENLVKIIVERLTNLKYFNLDQSILSDYGQHLVHFGSKIRTFIAAPDYNDFKYSIINGLLKGYGRNLEELVLKIKALDRDSVLFDTIGNEFAELISFKCHFESKRITINSLIISGLSKLSKLKVLYLEESNLSNPYISVFDDESLLSIMRECSQLEELTINAGKNDNKDIKNITDYSLSQTNQLLPNLTLLRLKSVDITDETLISIELLNKLKSLHLDSIQSVSKNGIKNLMDNCLHLDIIDVHKCGNE